MRGPQPRSSATPGACSSLTRPRWCSSDALHHHCDDVGRDRDAVAVTVLDLPVVGQDRDRWARLAGLGVTTVFLATPDLDGPGDVLALAGLNA